MAQPYRAPPAAAHPLQGSPQGTLFYAPSARSAPPQVPAHTSRQPGMATLAMARAVAIPQTSGQAITWRPAQVVPTVPQACPLPPSRRITVAQAVPEATIYRAAPSAPLLSHGALPAISPWTSPAPLSPQGVLSSPELTDGFCSSAIVDCGSKPVRADDILAAVVVTVACGRLQHDPLERSPQHGHAGTYVASYRVKGSSLPSIAAMLGEEAPFAAGPDLIHSEERFDLMIALLVDIEAVDPTSVVFQWDCCALCAGGCCDERGYNAEELGRLVHLILMRGHMATFSDYSLRVLLRDWQEQYLGGNPFVDLGEFSDTGLVSLFFDPRQLSDCPSVQLRRVGKVCVKGRAEFSFPLGIAAYSVNRRRLDAASYRIEVLSVCKAGSEDLQLPSGCTCKAGGHRGAAGHVMLRYASGGILFTSALQWAEPALLGVSEERLLQVVSESYGQTYCARVQALLATCPTVHAKISMAQNLALQYIQQGVPCEH